MSTTSLTRRCTMAVRQGLSTFLAIAGIVAIVLGLLYLFYGSALPHVLQVSSYASHPARRATACLVAGAACVIVAWLIRARRRT